MFGWLLAVAAGNYPYSVCFDFRTLRFSDALCGAPLRAEFDAGDMLVHRT